MLEQAFETALPTAGPPTSSSSSASGLITRYCNYLGLTVPIQLASSFVVSRVTEEGILDGRSPITIAASSILFTCAIFGVNKSAREISDVAGVQDSTIKNGYKYALLPLPCL